MNFFDYFNVRFLTAVHSRLCVTVFLSPRSLALVGVAFYGDLRVAVEAIEKGILELLKNRLETLEPLVIRL
jgi:hypothetical protein